jgi:alcohol dehydrogenase
MAYEFFVKSDIAFGNGCIKELPRLLSQHNIRHVMVVYDAGVKAAGIAEKLLAVLNGISADVTIFDKVIPNPTNEIVEEAAVMAREKKIDGFVAIGGGSSIDLAKAVDLLMTNPSPVGQYGGIGKVSHEILPLIAIPTTAGTSSEITNVVALIDTKTVCKYVIIDNKLTPSHVIADPELTRTMPASVTAATGMDAITHAVESYISNMATPLTEYNSLKGLGILYRNLPAAVENGNDMNAREQMMLGCIITGFGFSNANLGLVHGIAHVLSAHFHLAHGMANAAVLPYVLEFNAASCPEKMVTLAETIGCSVSRNRDDDKLLISEELRKLTKRVGIRTLSEQGIKESDFGMLSDDVLKEPVLHFNPRQHITKEQIIEILHKAF